MKDELITECPHQFICLVCNSPIYFCDKCGRRLCICTDYSGPWEYGETYCEPDCPDRSKECYEQ